ncbi:MAG: double zinc ribbon domain-containing protein [Rhodospirillales bacterium]
MLHRLANALLDAVLPRLCLACDEVVATPGLCAACWAAMPWTAPPVCDACGLPFDLEQPGLRLCVACAGSRGPPLRRIRAALAYEQRSRELILRFKHADRLDAAPSFAAWMAAVGGELLDEADLVAPVPLHWTRLAWRRYNQAALLGRLVTRRRPALFVPDLLRRRRRTPSQGELGPAARRRNVAGAFAMVHRHADKVAGRRVLLVDDVLTTGATLDACARVLSRHGAAAVDALVLMRVTKATAPRMSGKPRSAGLASET